MWIHDYKPVTEGNSSNDDPFPGTSLVDDIFRELLPSTPGDELSQYLGEARYSGSQNLLEIWQSLEGRYPSLAKMARDYLAVPGSTVGIERVFSNGGRLVSPQRSRLSSLTIEQLMLLKDWMTTVPTPSISISAS